MLNFNLKNTFKINIFRLSKAIVKECSITHQNPIAIEAQQFYVHLLVNLLKGQEPNVSFKLFFID
jgi:ADP-ribosylglycohydrolase